MPGTHRSRHGRRGLRPGPMPRGPKKAVLCSVLTQCPPQLTARRGHHGPRTGVLTHSRPLLLAVSWVPPGRRRGSRQACNHGPALSLISTSISATVGPQSTKRPTGLVSLALPLVNRASVHPSRDFAPCGAAGVSLMGTCWGLPLGLASSTAGPPSVHTCGSEVALLARAAGLLQNSRRAGLHLGTGGSQAGWRVSIKTGSRSREVEPKAGLGPRGGGSQVSPRAWAAKAHLRPPGCNGGGPLENLEPGKGGLSWLYWAAATAKGLGVNQTEPKKVTWLLWALMSSCVQWVYTGPV